jgi:hypothetical protein
MFVKAGDAAALSLASRTGILIECVLAYATKLLTAGVFGNDELRGLAPLAYLLSLLQLLAL